MHRRLRGESGAGQTRRDQSDVAGADHDEGGDATKDAAGEAALDAGRGLRVTLEI
jgi:hypothetical protein